MLLDRR